MKNVDAVNTKSIKLSSPVMRTVPRSEMHPSDSSAAAANDRSFLFLRK